MRQRRLTVLVSAGESQQSGDTTGALITAAQSVGNFINLQLKNQVGQWSLKMASSNPYTVRVIGERLCAKIAFLGENLFHKIFYISSVFLKCVYDHIY